MRAATGVAVRSVRMVRLGLTLGLVSGLAGCINVDLPLSSLERGELVETVIEGEGDDRILLLDVDGVISERGQNPGALGIGGRESLVARVRQQLDRAREEESLRAVVLRINSPGGTVTASDVLYHELAAFKEEVEIPLIAACMSTCTSGAYYLAVAADRIVALPTTITGSIGVISQSVNLTGMLEKIGVENQTLKSGPFKDAGSPLREMTSEERVQLQGVIDGLYERFVDVVDQGRPDLEREALEPLADGRIYTSAQAKEAGLIDDIAYLPETLEAVRDEAGLEEAKIVVYHRRGEIRENLYSAETPVSTPMLSGLLGRPGFLYLWWPGL